MNASTCVCLLLIVIGTFFLFHKSKILPLKYERENITVGFMGDVMIGRLVNTIIPQKGYKYMWGNTRATLSALDYIIANLETTLTTSIEQVPKVFNFKSDPKNVQSLIDGHISVVNLANNHSLDFSQEGLFETIEVLNGARILHVGAGNNATEAARAVILEKKGIRIGIIGFTDYEPSWKAQEQKPGVNYVAIGDIQKIQKDIQPVRNNVDILIATIHWGPNMRLRPTQEFIDFAHAMIDSGIDVIHGHSAHVVQGIEIYKGKLIMYDTGDFIDDYAVDPELRNDLSFLFTVSMNKKGITKISLMPVKIDHMQVNRAQENDYRFIVNRMKKLCAEFGTQLIEKDDLLEVTITKKKTDY